MKDASLEPPLQSFSLARRIVAEALGTALLLAVVSFANPAVTLARSLSDTFAGIAPSSAPAFIAAQRAGAVVAVSVMGWLLRGERPAPD